MKIIKEIRLARTEEDRVVQYGNPNYGIEQMVKPRKVSAVGVIRTNCYAKDFAHISMLVAIARQDFPDLVDEEIRVTHYGGKYYAGTYGIEFNLPDTTEAPESYSPIQELELVK